MTRILKSVQPCAKCGSEMTDCTTSGYLDVWGISKCKNEECSGWKDATTMIKEGSLVEKVD